MNSSVTCNILPAKTVNTLPNTTTELLQNDQHEKQDLGEISLKEDVSEEFLHAETTSFFDVDGPCAKSATSRMDLFKAKNNSTSKQIYMEKRERRRQTAVAVAVMLLSDSEDEEEGHEKRVWMKPWSRQHDSQGAFPNLVKELEMSDLSSFRNYLRMGPEQFRDLAEKIRPVITRDDTNFRKAVSVEERLAVTLRFLATGESYKSISYSFRLGSTTIGKIVPETCLALYDVLKYDYMKMPQSPEEWLGIANKFMEKWNFPNTLGSIDGKHVALRAPHHSGSAFYNYKNFFSIVLLGLVDADYKFIYVEVGCNGRISDDGVFAGCSLAEALNKRRANIPVPSELPGDHGLMSYHIIGDDAFPLRDDLMKPFPFRNMTREQRIFNYRLSRAWRVVENAFGILCSRFRVFLSRIALEPNKAEALVLGACALHNYLLTKKDGQYVTSGLVDQESATTHEVTSGSWRNESTLASTGIQHSNFSAPQPRQKREKLMEFCCSPEGAVDWQDNMISTVNE